MEGSHSNFEYLEVVFYLYDSVWTVFKPKSHCRYIQAIKAGKYLSCINTSNFVFSLYISALGTRVWGGNQFPEGAPHDVPQKAGGVRAEAPYAGAADQ